MIGKASVTGKMVLVGKLVLQTPYYWWASRNKGERHRGT